MSGSGCQVFFLVSASVESAGSEQKVVLLNLNRNGIKTPEKNCLPLASRLNRKNYSRCFRLLLDGLHHLYFSYPLLFFKFRRSKRGLCRLKAGLQMGRLHCGRAIMYRADVDFPGYGHTRPCPGRRRRRLRRISKAERRQTRCQRYWRARIFRFSTLKNRLILR